MKAKFIFSIFVVLILSVGKMNAQIMPAVTSVALSEQDRTTLSQYLSEYTTFTMDKRALVENLHNNGRAQFQIRIDEKRDWTFDLRLNDMRSYDFRQTYTTDEGEFESNEPFVVNTFKGGTSDGRIARFTIDENNFFGVILDNQYHYVIRPASDYTRNRSDNSFIVYRSTDVISASEYFDYIHYALEAPENSMKQDVVMRDNAETSYVPCTYYFTIATDADYEFFQKMGRCLINSYSYIFSVLNIVEGVYESTFNMRFLVSFQHVWRSDTFGWSIPQTNGEQLMRGFQIYWQYNRRNVWRNIAHLFSGRETLIYPPHGSVDGIAHRGQISNSIGQPNNSDAFSFSRLRQGMFQTTAHEIGHHLNALDLQAPYGECACTGSNASVMCPGRTTRDPLWFCQTSINQIQPFLEANSAYLIGNFPEISIPLPEPTRYFHEHRATKKIISGEQVIDGFIIYRAPEVWLIDGFEIISGEVVIDDISCQ